MPEVIHGGVYLYRVIATCSLCGRTDDVGPFELLRDAVAEQLPGWLNPTVGTYFRLNDESGMPITLCPDCVRKPLREIVDGLRLLRG